MKLGYIIMHAHVDTHKIKLYIMYVYCTTKYHMQILHLIFAGSLVEKGQKEATMQSKKWLNQKALQELVSLIILVRSALQVVGFQKGRFGPRKPIIVIDFALCSSRN